MFLRNHKWISGPIIAQWYILLSITSHVWPLETTIINRNRMVRNMEYTYDWPLLAIANIANHDPVINQWWQIGAISLGNFLALTWLTRADHKVGRIAWSTFWELRLWSLSMDPTNNHGFCMVYGLFHGQKRKAICYYRYNGPYTSIDHGKSMVVVYVL